MEVTEVPLGGEVQRKKRYDPIRRAYDNTEILAREPSGSPGTPHRYFNSSYSVSFVGGGGEDARQAGSHSSEDLKISKEEEENSKEVVLDQVVHRHVNGLCVVTAGEALVAMCSSPSSVSVSTVELLKAECENQSVGGKKKKHKKAKSARNKNSSKGGEGEKGAATPDGILAIANLSDGRKVKLRCCVLGTILEVNRRLEGTDGNPSLLVTDPLLDGYLAVILPTGPFPLSLESIDKKTLA